MTTAVNPSVQRALRRAAVAATRAASLLDSQPWRFVLRRDSVEIHVDRARQLHRLDPNGRGLWVSCGAALTNLVLSLTADGVGSHIERLPDPHRSDLVATVCLDRDESPVDDPLAAALRIAALDVTPHPAQSPAATLRDLCWPSVVTVPVDARAEVDRLIQESGRRLANDSAAQVERGRARSAAASADAGGSAAPVLAVVTAPVDSRAAWVRAGECYQAAVLDCALAGVTTDEIVPVIAYADLRARLRAAIGTDDLPQLLFRISDRPARPAVRRRRLVDMLVEGS